MDPKLAGELYTFLINKPEYSTSHARRELVGRPREALVKNVALQGVCRYWRLCFLSQPVSAPRFRISHSQGNIGRPGPRIVPRERNGSIRYTSRTCRRQLRTFATHKKFDFISREITYGLYLSDHSILDSVATELVTLAGIMIQNLQLETA